MNATELANGQQILLGYKLWTVRRMPGQIRLEIAAGLSVGKGWLGSTLDIEGQLYRVIRANTRSLYVIAHLQE